MASLTMHEKVVVNKKVAPPNSPSHQSLDVTPQGTLDMAPPGTLARFAEKAGVAPSKLSTLTITLATREPYVAILEYAAMSEPPTEPMPGAQERHPLFLAPEDAFEFPKAQVSDSEDEENDVSIDFSLDRTRRRMSRHCRSFRVPASSALKRRTPIPKFKFGLGETELVWPPPPELTAEYLVELRDGKERRKKKKGGCGEKAEVVNGDAAGGSGNEGDTPSEDKGSGSDSTQESFEEKEEEVEKQIVIYLSHYSIGEPHIIDRGDSRTHREILLATTEEPGRLRSFMKDCIQWRADKDHREAGGSKFTLQRFRAEGRSGYWENEGFKRARPVESVVLADGQMEAIMEDVLRFLQPECKKWYAQHGLPRRRSYLFYGPPGTGKTSTIRAIASKFGFNCCFLSMTDCSFSNQMLCDALSQIPRNALLVLEDVDALFNEDRRNENTSSLTFSGMLNALDGVVSVDGVITTMTTNHIDRLDKALVRGGRVDRRFHFGLPTEQQIGKLFQTFYPEADGEVATRFAQAVFARPEGQELRSIATLQNLFVQHRESTMEECIEGLGEFCETHFPEGTDAKNQHIYS